MFNFDENGFLIDLLEVDLNSLNYDFSIDSFMEDLKFDKVVFLLSKYFLS